MENYEYFELETDAGEITLIVKTNIGINSTSFIGTISCEKDAIFSDTEIIGVVVKACNYYENKMSKWLKKSLSNSGVIINDE